MTQPLPSPSDSVPEELPLRHRAHRARDAERIRQEFVQSRKRSYVEAGDASANPLARDEQ
jgi:hypothetical protein